MPTNPLDLFISGGEGGVAINPSADSRTGANTQNVNFGSSSQGFDFKQLLVIGGFVLIGLKILKG